MEILQNLFGKYSEPVLFYWLSFIMLLLFVDRGIIPGAPQQFNSFIEDSLGVTSPDVYFGLLQSIFVVGFSAAGIIFGSISHKFSPFTLMTIGVTVWWTAIVLCGVSYYCNSYYFLLVCRIFSGVGEAAVIVTAPAFIASRAGSKTGHYMGIFYSAVPIGTAAGYTFSAAVAGSPAKWPFAYFIEAMLMMPAIVVCFATAHRYPSAEELHVNDQTSSSSSNSTIQDASMSKAQQDSLDASSKKPKLVVDPIEQWKSVCFNPVFLAVSLGNAAYMWTLIGVSTFGPQFIMALGYFDSQQTASTVFGVCISVAGVIGTPLGGVLIDRAMAKRGMVNPTKSEHEKSKMMESDNDSSTILSPMQQRSDDVSSAATQSSSSSSSSSAVMDSKPLPTVARYEAEQLRVVTWQCFLFSTLGAIIMCAETAKQSIALFFFCVTVGSTLLLILTAGMTVGAMLAVKQEHRSFALAMNAAACHLFGDVPSNLVIGWLKTKLAPDCSGSDDAVYTSDECRGDADGVRLTIFIANVWLFWCVILFFAAYWMSNRRLETVIEKETREGVHHPGTSVPGDSPANNLKQPLLQA